MAKENSANNKLTRGDKEQKKFIEKYGVFKDGVIHSFDSLTTIHKQTLDSADDYYDRVAKSQEMERIQLYDIIKTSDDEMKCKKAYARLKELDDVLDERIEKHNNFIQNESNKENKNVVGVLLAFATAGGLLISNKQVQKKLIDIGNSIIRK